MPPEKDEANSELKPHLSSSERRTAFMPIINLPYTPPESRQGYHDDGKSVEPVEEESDDEWISGDKFPQHVIRNDNWKMITKDDLKRCIINADALVAQVGRRVMMTREKHVSPPMTDERRERLAKAIQTLNDAVLEGKAEMKIFTAETLAIDCMCGKED